MILTLKIFENETQTEVFSLNVVMFHGEIDFGIFSLLFLWFYVGIANLLEQQVRLILARGHFCVGEAGIIRVRLSLCDNFRSQDA